jgi:hypothetical protein
MFHGNSMKVFDVFIQISRKIQTVFLLPLHNHADESLITECCEETSKLVVDIISIPSTKN